MKHTYKNFDFLLSHHLTLQTSVLLLCSLNQFLVPRIDSLSLSWHKTKPSPCNIWTCAAIYPSSSSSFWSLPRRKAFIVATFGSTLLLASGNDLWPLMKSRRSFDVAKVQLLRSLFGGGGMFGTCRQWGFRRWFTGSSGGFGTSVSSLAEQTWTHRWRRPRSIDKKGNDLFVTAWSL